MRRVLVGDDGSEAAARAVEWAERFAKERGTQLTAVQVTATGDGDDGSAHQGLQRVTVRGDHTASAIMEAAADLDVDLIVLGRRGRGGFPSLPVGTTVHNVAGACGRPVVVVPVVELSSHEPLIQRVVVGLDGRPGSEMAATWAAENFGLAHFTAVHALELAPAFTHDDDKTSVEMYERARERAMVLLRDSWCRPFADAAVEFDALVEEGRAAEVVLRTARGADADLVVVGRREPDLMRGTLGGVSQRVLAFAPRAAAVVSSPG